MASRAVPRRRQPDRSRAPSVPEPPRIARDPWGWASLAALLPLLLKSLGAPLGEPVADDFDFLHHALLLHRHGLLDGGGSAAFWRPLAHQIYYTALGPLILTHPWAVAALHGVLLALCALLLYRTFRWRFAGPVAAACATFPLLAESARELIAWPSHFVELGTLFFAVVALHEAAARRGIRAFLALAGSLLCKETGVVAALLLPWMPAVRGPITMRERLRWAGGAGLVLLGYGVLYLYTRRHAGLELPHHLETDRAIAATSWLTRLGWSFWNSLRAMMSLPAIPSRDDAFFGVAAAALVVAAGVFLIADRTRRARLEPARPWILWGLAWFLVFAMGLTAIYPIWAPYRAAFGAIGLGVALVAWLGAGEPWLIAPLVALRLATVAASQGPPPLVSSSAPESGAFIDFERLVRLQRLMIDTRTTLQAAFPTLPHGARVGQHYMPRGALYAFEGDKALQIWYRDTTVRWVPFTAYRSDPGLRLATIVEYQPHRAPQAALVEPAAMRALLEAADRIARSDWAGALARLGRADSLQRDAGAAVFRATVASKRALCRLELGAADDAAREARHGLDLWADNFDSRYVLASVALARDQLDEAEAQLDTLLAASPGDSSAAQLLRTVRATRAQRARP